MNGSKFTILTFLPLFFLTMGSLSSQEFGFKTKDNLKSWECSGDVSIDPSQGQGSLKIGPGGKAILTLLTEEGAGKVSFKVYDDMWKPEDIKQRLVGPIYGLGDASGALLMTGAIYAPYLAGDQIYAILKQIPILLSHTVKKELIQMNMEVIFKANSYTLRERYPSC